MSLKFSEIEYKWAADHVPIDQFNDWMFELAPPIRLRRYNEVTGTDTYFCKGNQVIRQREDGNLPHCLTIKLRRSTESIANRVEVDMFVDEEPNVSSKFLDLLGFKPEIAIIKTSYIHSIHDSDVGVTTVIYDVDVVIGKQQKRRRFIEIEIDKQDGLSVQKAMRVLGRWKKKMEKAFELGEPLNQSLFELYTGKNYAMAKEND